MSAFAFFGSHVADVPVHVKLSASNGGVNGMDQRLQPRKGSAWMKFPGTFRQGFTMSDSIAYEFSPFLERGPRTTFQRSHRRQSKTDFLFRQILVSGAPAHTPRRSAPEVLSRRGRNNENEYVVEQVCAARLFYIISCIADDTSLRQYLGPGQVRLGAKLTFWKSPEQSGLFLFNRFF